MDFQQTQKQSASALQHAQELSLADSRPPAEIPGYQATRFLGSGAYGEVWAAIERSTSRPVAIKFFTHGSGLDVSLLSREVEKLALLAAERYAVQLLQVGWDHHPPYYVMEFFERGSLEDRIRREGPLPAGEAVQLFYEILTGLANAHDRGILHCDLKPANILLDQNNRPRLADFGQSRLREEQTPSLGTLFYMAPEQANLRAVPDASWDVYGVGAVFYCILTGEPPRRSREALSQIETAEELSERLARYQRVLADAPPLTAHRAVPGMDRALRGILDRCLATEPGSRYPNVQSVLDALNARQRWRNRRPLVALGAISPALLVAVMAIAAWWGFSLVVDGSDAALTQQAVESNRFAAQSVAKVAGSELERRYNGLEEFARDGEFQRALQTVLGDPEGKRLRGELRRPEWVAEAGDEKRARLRALPALQTLQKSIEGAHRRYDERRPLGISQAASWFVTDDHGVQLARSPHEPGEANSVGRYYGWRTYFCGGLRDREKEWLSGQWEPGPRDRIARTHLSAVFRSQATNRWVVAISTPIVTVEGQFLGTLALTINVGEIAVLEGQRPDDQFAVLVDWRDGDHKGQILQHPVFDRMAEGNRGRLPPEFAQRLTTFRLKEDEIPSAGNEPRRADYRDPLDALAGAGGRARRWLAAMEEVVVAGKEHTGWLVIVQQAYDTAIGGTLGQLRAGLLRTAMLALGAMALLITGVWGFVIWVVRGSPDLRRT